MLRKESDKPVYAGRHAIGKPGAGREVGRDKKAPERMERLYAVEERLCPMISAYTGMSCACITGHCRMWVDSEHLKYLMSNVKGDCGYRLLSLYAGFELDRIARYDSEMRDVV